MGVYINSDVKIDMQLTETYWKTFSSDQIPSLLEKFNEMSHPEVTLSLCNKFIKLGHRTFIEDISALFLGQYQIWKVELLGYQQQHYNEHKAAIDSAVAAWEKLPKSFDTSASNWRSRLLLTPTPANSLNIVRSDVQVMSTIPIHSDLSISPNTQFIGSAATIDVNIKFP